MVHNIREHCNFEEEADMLNLKRLPFGDLEVQNVVHDVTIVLTSERQVPWMAELYLTIDTMQEFSKLVDPSCRAPWDGSRVFKDRLRQA